MFLVLLFLAALGQLAAGNVFFRKDVTGDISDCPVSYFGATYTTFYLGVESDKLAICFKGPYPATTNNDCVLIEKGVFFKGSWATKQTVKQPGSGFHRALPSLTGTSTCYTRVTFAGSNNKKIQIYMRQFGDQSAVLIALKVITPPLDVTTQIGGWKFDQWRLNSVNNFRDMSACDATGETAVCSQNVASVSLYGCFLARKGIAYTDLHLNNQSCRGQIDNVTHMVTFSFDGNNACGTVVAANSSHLIFKNSIMSENNNIKINFSCFYTQPGIQSIFLKAEDNAVIQQLVSGQWNYTLSMTAYTNEEHTKAIDTNTRIKLQQVVWVELKADELDGNMVVLVTDSCWATNEASPSASLRYELVVNGCPNPTDQTVKVENNGLGTSNFFSFRMFHFSDKNNDVHLHCQLHLCENLSGTCAPSCGGGWRRRRRSVRAEHEDGDAALITMSWTH